MSNAEKHTRSWSLADIQKYLDGELPPGEMHALERAALDDPFLADALEGLATREPEMRQQDLAELQTRLDNRVQRQKQAPLLPGWMKVAAVLILLAGLAFIVVYTTLPRTATAPPATVSRAPVTIAPASPATVAPPAAASDSASIAATSNADAIAAKPSDVRLPPIARIRRQKPAVIYKNTDTAFVVSKGTASRQPTIADSPAFGSVSSAPAPAINNYSFLKATPKPLVFSGRVLDLNNRPLAGATLSLFGNRQATITDDQGMFNLYVPPLDTSRRITVAMVGYIPTSYSLSTDDLTGNIIRLRENQSSLAEVVITRDGAKRKETFARVSSDEPENVDSLWQKAIPLIGRVAYMDYLQTGKKGLGVDSTIRGTERISFAVDRKGMPADFRIEQSLSPLHDAGVIRLISSGSSWTMLHGKKTRVEVSVTFP